MTTAVPGDPTEPVTLDEPPAPTPGPAAPAPTDPSQRRKVRERRILRSGVASSANQILGAACTLVTVPIAIRRLSPEAFGVWITLSSLIVVLGFLDLGIGAALIGGVARAEAAGERRRAQEMISSAFLGLAGLSVVLGAMFWLVYPHVPWASLLGVDGGAHPGDVGRSVAIVAAGILLSVPLNVAARAQAGLQEGDVVVLWRGVGNVVQLVWVGILFFTHGTLVWFVLAVTAGPVFGSLLNSAALYLGERSWLHLDWQKASVKVFRRLGSAGFLFFVLLIASTIAYQSDALIIAHFLGSTAAGEYGVPFRLFMFVPNIVSLALMPLWPAYADAWEVGDVEWIRNTFRRSVLFAAAANGAVGLVLLVTARRIIGVWAGSSVHPSNTFLGALFLYVLVWGVSASMAMLFNGCGVVKFQIAIALGMAALNLPLSIALLSPLDVAGPVVGTIVAQTAVVLVPAFAYKRRLLDPDHPKRPPARRSIEYWDD